MDIKINFWSIGFQYSTMSVVVPIEKKNIEKEQKFKCTFNLRELKLCPLT